MDRLNRGLFSFASYKAGPAKIRRIRAKACELGLTLNFWFNNVELVAGDVIGRETVDYVSNIYNRSHGVSGDCGAAAAQSFFAAHHTTIAEGASGISR